MLGRETSWRQGSVLAEKDAKSIGLVDSLSPKKRIIIISHDCDLPYEKETKVEAIVGDVIEKLDNHFIGSRNPRCLHLSYTNPTGDKTYIELKHIHRCEIDKSSLHPLTPEGQISPNDKHVLKQWLAARYGRPAFPNSFEARLRSERKNVEAKIAKIVDSGNPYLVGLYFDLGENRWDELPQGEPYVLSILVVYDLQNGGREAGIAAETAAEQLEALFRHVYGQPDEATEIALEQCTAVDDTRVTIADLRIMSQWRVEYISLREGPASPCMSIGEMPP